MEQMLSLYYTNNAKKLREMANSILCKFGGLSDKDYHEFYSIANEVFVDVMRRYDGEQDFNGFLYSCLSNKFKSEMTKMNRQKRLGDRTAVSLDNPIGDSGNLTIEDKLQSDFNLEDQICDSQNEYSEKMMLYLSRLSVLQKEVLNLIAIGHTVSEIITKLHITEQQYNDCYNAIHSYRNTSILM